MTTSRRPQRAMAAAVALLLCAACTGGAEEVRSAGSSSTSPSASASGGAPDHDHMASADPAGQTDVRLHMEQALGHHAVLMIRLMRGPVDKEQTFVAAAQGALDRNTDELVEAVVQAYGDDAGPSSVCCGKSTSAYCVTTARPWPARTRPAWTRRCLRSMPMQTGTGN